MEHHLCSGGEVDFDQELVDASKLTAVDIAGATQRTTLFPLRRWKSTTFTKWVQELEG